MLRTCPNTTLAVERDVKNPTLTLSIRLQAVFLWSPAVTLLPTVLLQRKIRIREDNGHSLIKKRYSKDPEKDTVTLQQIYKTKNVAEYHRFGRKGCQTNELKEFLRLWIVTCGKLRTFPNFSVGCHGSRECHSLQSLLTEVWEYLQE